MVDERLPKDLGILALTRTGVTLAVQLREHYPRSECYVPRRHRFALAMGAVGFRRLKKAFHKAWHCHEGLVCIMATGIVVRLVAPLLVDKRNDPAVVVMDERGRFTISLLSGHLGGANALARDVAVKLGSTPVITTASDLSSKPAIDLMAQEAGLEVEDPAWFTRVARAILEEEPLWIHDPDDRLPGLVTGLPWATRIQNLGDREVATLCSTSHVGIWISERMAPPHLPCLQLRPKVLVVGVGCNRGASAAEILALIEEVFREAVLSVKAIRNLASIDIKADERGLLDAARSLDRPVHWIDRETLAGVGVPNPSGVVLDHVGVHSVCEAAALISSENRDLLVTKQKTANVTVAVARVASVS